MSGAPSHDASCGIAGKLRLECQSKWLAETGQVLDDYLYRGTREKTLRIKVYLKRSAPPQRTHYLQRALLTLVTKLIALLSATLNAMTFYSLRDRGHGQTLKHTYY